MPNDATEILMPPQAVDWPETLKAQLASNLTWAGVLIPIIERDHALTLLLTQRSEELTHHAGQVSFPGGRMEEHDENLAATALRETHEEVGIDPANITILGYLDAMPTITGYAVTPVVGLVSGEPELDIDHSEVEYAFEVPLEFLLDSGNDVVVEREVQGFKLPLVEFHWANERIWGATAQMVLMFRKLLINK